MVMENLAVVIVMYERVNFFYEKCKFRLIYRGESRNFFRGTGIEL